MKPFCAVVKAFSVKGVFQLLEVSEHLVAPPRLSSRAPGKLWLGEAVPWGNKQRIGQDCFMTANQQVNWLPQECVWP